MADIPQTIDQLNPAGTLTGAENVPVTQSGSTVRVSLNLITVFINSAVEAAGAVATGIAAHLAAYVHADIAHSNRSALDLVTGINTGDQDIAAWLNTNRPGIASLESAGNVNSWVPSDVSGAGLTLSGVNCRYVKIGKLVQVTGQITWPTTANAAVAMLGGLPFDPIADQNGIAFNTIGSSLFGSCLAMPGQKIQFYNNFGSTTGRANSVLSGATVYVNISYITA